MHLSCAAGFDADCLVVHHASCPMDRHDQANMHVKSTWLPHMTHFCHVLLYVGDAMSNMKKIVGKGHLPRVTESHREC